jgi:Leucine-rich repeat (LRR) protein
MHKKAQDGWVRAGLEILSAIEYANQLESSELDLSGHGIDHLPSEIGGLANLTFSRLDDNQVTVLPP